MEPAHAAAGFSPPPTRSAAESSGPAAGQGGGWVKYCTSTIHIAIVSCNMVCHSQVKTYLQVDSLNKELDTKRARDTQPGNDNFDFYSDSELSGR